MNLQTNISIPEGNPMIDYSSKVFLLGSCFSENIGDQFQYYKFQSLQNPFGILFHPFAIENFLKRVRFQQQFNTNDVFRHNETWSSFEAHSRLNALTEQEIVEKLNSALANSYAFIEEATHVIITYGTSWMYRHVETDKYVANCHKIPQKEFEKELISAASLQESIEKSIQYIQQVNPRLQFIFTISPVRHAKDGFVENQRSKAHLISAVHQTIQEKESMAYFPSYELVMDELRDYRFYAEDMLHPNQLAIQYIWEKFSTAWLSPKSFPVMKKVENIQLGLQHKPFNIKSEAHRQFQEKLQQKIAEVSKVFPHIKF